ncbi:hypothetical protein HZB00_03725 [Candidatus Woesearchaeota archaeon]|nr:hypothetical protein [Candidatus Woesearchaeota archaeon]
MTERELKKNDLQEYILLFLKDIMQLAQTNLHAKKPVFLMAHKLYIKENMTPI